MQNFKIVLTFTAYEIAHLMEALQTIPTGTDWKTSIIIKVQDAIASQINKSDID